MVLKLIRKLLVIKFSFDVRKSKSRVYICTSTDKAIKLVAYRKCLAYVYTFRVWHLSKGGLLPVS